MNVTDIETALSILTTKYLSIENRNLRKSCVLVYIGPSQSLGAIVFLFIFFHLIQNKFSWTKYEKIRDRPTTHIN